MYGILSTNDPLDQWSDPQPTIDAAVQARFPHASSGGLRTSCILRDILPFAKLLIKLPQRSDSPRFHVVDA